MLDDLVPHTTLRWIFTIAIIVAYILRALWLQGWYIVSYALAIYLLNLFIAFLTPRFDPAQREDDEIGTHSTHTHTVHTHTHTHTHTLCHSITNS